MRKSKRNHSILTLLLVPILATTLALLILATLILSHIFSTHSEERTVKSSKEILRQTDLSLQFVHNNIAQVSTSIKQTPALHKLLASPIENQVDLWKQYQTFGGIFNDIPQSIIDYDIVIFGLDDFSIAAKGTHLPKSNESFLNMEIFNTAISTGHIEYGYYSSGFPSADSNTPVIVGCRALKDSNGILYGGVLMIIPEFSLRSFYQHFTDSHHNIMLLSSKGRIYSSNISSELGHTNFSLLHIAELNKDKKDAVSHTKDNKTVLSRYLPYYDAYLISVVTPDVFEDISPFKQILAIIICTLLLLTLLTVWIIRHYLKPLKLLAGQMTAAKDMPNYTALKSSVEINAITSAYNEMVHTIHTYVAKLNVAHEKELKDKLDLLQMQINPHFLYNTLDSIKLLIERGNSSESKEIIEALTSLLRSTLSKTNTMVLISKETINLENYLTIIKPRYGGQITTDLFVEPETMDFEIPNLLLQPLVENAFFHAFQIQKQGTIRIFISLIKNRIHCSVIDNGDGMSDAKIKKVLSNSSNHISVTNIGLINIKERLELIYQDQCEFSIMSEPGLGTNISLSFPAIKPSQ